MGFLTGGRYWDAMIGMDVGRPRMTFHCPKGGVLMVLEVCVWGGGGQGSGMVHLVSGAPLRAWQLGTACGIRVHPVSTRLDHSRGHAHLGGAFLGLSPAAGPAPPATIPEGNGQRIVTHLLL